MTATQFGLLRGLVIDVDGVLWHGDHTLAGVCRLFDFLRAHQIAFIIATNNSARPGSEIVERLAGLGVEITEDQVLTSAQATALYLPRVAPRGARVLVVGGQGLKDEVTRVGYELVDQAADVVVAGIDWDLTYDKLKRATIEIRHGAKFVGTNADKTYPGAEGIIPGAGAILAAIQTATDVAPLVIGKPEPAMFDIAVEKMRVPGKAAAMLGDRLDTDIAGAQRAGLTSILVLTGVTTREALVQSTVQPDWVFENLDTLCEMWQRAY